MIAEEMVGVDVEPRDHARRSEPQDAPVVARPALAARFPPVHPLAAVGVLVGDEDAAPGLQQVLGIRYQRLERKGARLRADRWADA